MAGFGNSGGNSGQWEDPDLDGVYTLKDGSGIGIERLSNIRVASEFDGVLDGLKAAADDAGIGGTVLVPPGEYLADSSAETESFPDDVTFIGYGATLKMPDGSDWDSVINLASSQGWHFKGLTFDGNRANTTGQRYFFGTRGGSAAGGFKFTDCAFINCERGYWSGNGGDHGSSFANVDGVNNGKTIDANGDHISVTGGHHDTVAIGATLKGNNCRIEGSTLVNHVDGGYAFFLDGANYSSIVGCRVDGSASGFDLIHVDDGQGNRVIDCTAINGGDTGILVFNPDSTAEDNIISGCTVVGCDISGIRVLGEGPATVADNVCLNNGQDTGISATWKRAGIHVGAPNTTITGNVCRDDQTTKTQVNGIGLDDGTADVTIADNKLAGNDSARVGYQSGRPPRVVINGWSVNAGDPNSTGDWNGSGYEGVQVRDTANLTNYAFVNGGWVAL